MDIRTAILKAADHADRYHPAPLPAAVREIFDAASFEAQFTNVDKKETENV